MNRGLHSTDVLISTALIASGNNFQKMAMFAKFLKLPFPSQSSFGKIQRTYVLPSIDQIWEIHQNEVLNEFQGKNLVILGIQSSNILNTCSADYNINYIDRKFHITISLF